MPLYSVYGNRLESDVEFPELALADRGPTRWRFRIDPELPAMQSPEERGPESQPISHVHLPIVVEQPGEPMPKMTAPSVELFSPSSVSSRKEPNF